MDRSDELSLNSHELESEDSENAAFLDKGKEREQRYRRPSSLRHRIPWRWITSTVIISLLCFYLGRKSTFREHSLSTYEHGFRTDFAPITPVVGLKKVIFTGGLEYDENGTLYRDVGPNEPLYAGPAGPEVDEAWKNLMQGLEFVLTGDEAEDFRGRTVEEPETGAWRMSVDVYHSLHCVDVVRKALDPDYYEPKGGYPYFHRIHVDHCIDYLRQAIQCHSDLTPLYYHFSPREKNYVPDFGSAHTCRDFGKIDEWILAHHREIHEQDRYEHGELKDMWKCGDTHCSS